jgi:PPOX class probable F420-dependent enzyme
VRLDEATCRRLVSQARVARLATVAGDGTPHLVPIVFALMDDALVTAVDHKPKSTTRLRRIENLKHRPHASVLVDRYDDDWDALWWVRMDGAGEVHHDNATLETVRTALAERYADYRSLPPAGPAIVIRIERWSGWRASQTAAEY